MYFKKHLSENLDISWLIFFQVFCPFSHFSPDKFSHIISWQFISENNTSPDFLKIHFSLIIDEFLQFFFSHFRVLFLHCDCGNEFLNIWIFFAINQTFGDIRMGLQQIFDFSRGHVIIFVPEKLSR